MSSINDISKDNTGMLKTFGETIYDMSAARKITQQDDWSDAKLEELVGKLHGQGGRDIVGKTHSFMAKEEETSLERHIAEIS